MFLVAEGVDHALNVLGGTKNFRRARLGPVHVDGRGAGAIVVERLVLHQSGFGCALDHARRFPFQPRGARAPPRCVLRAL